MSSFSRIQRKIHREIRITGDLVTRVNYINEGGVDRRSGIFTFKTDADNAQWQSLNQAQNDDMIMPEINFKD